MSFSRVIIRFMLFIAFNISIVIIISAYLSTDQPVNPWGTIAASLAVITAIISAWGAIKVVEKQEDAQKPYLYPIFDATSRYMLVQLVVRNFGGSSAQDIKILWDKPLVNTTGKKITFSDNADGIEIPFLLQGESISIFVDGTNEMFKKFSNLNYTGYITYKDSSGRQFKHRFNISLEKHRYQLTYTDEGIKTHYELQKIPNSLSGIEKELKSISQKINK